MRIGGFTFAHVDSLTSFNCSTNQVGNLIRGLVAGIVKCRPIDGGRCDDIVDRLALLSCFKDTVER